MLLELPAIMCVIHVWNPLTPNTKGPRNFMNPKTLTIWWALTAFTGLVELGFKCLSVHR